MRKTGVLLAAMMMALLGTIAPAYAEPISTPTQYCDQYETWYGGVYAPKEWCYFYSEQRWVMLWDE